MTDFRRGFARAIGIALLAVEDADFFIPERQTELPLIGVSIPTALFFAIAPGLGRARGRGHVGAAFEIVDAQPDALQPGGDGIDMALLAAVARASDRERDQGIADHRRRKALRDSPPQRGTVPVMR